MSAFAIRREGVFWILDDCVVFREDSFIPYMFHVHVFQDLEAIEAFDLHVSHQGGIPGSRTVSVLKHPRCKTLSCLSC